MTPAEFRKLKAAEDARNAIAWGPEGLGYWMAEREKLTEEQLWEIDDDITRAKWLRGATPIDVERMRLRFSRLLRCVDAEHLSGDDYRSLGFPFNGRGKGIYKLMQEAGELPKDTVR